MMVNMVHIWTVILQSAMRVPYLARFHVYARCHTRSESVTVRILCLTEPDRAEHCLELQEDFKEICRSDFVEIFDKTEVEIKFSGNLLRVPDLSAAAQAQAHASKEGDAKLQIDFCEENKMHFRPFSDNRMSFVLKRRNDKNPYPKGRLSFFTGIDKVLYEEKIDLTKFL